MSPDSEDSGVDTATVERAGRVLAELDESDVTVLDLGPGRGTH